MEDNDIVKLNIGGSKFLTYRSTISRKLRKIAPRTEFYRLNLFQELLNDPKTKFYKNNEIFFDRNPQYFDFILDFYRFIKVDNEGNIDSIEFKERLPNDDFTLNCIKKEAEFYKIDHLVELLDAQLKNEFADSLILNKTLAKKLIKLCEFTQTSDWELIYRASRDGFSADDFHFKCDNVIKTLTLIQTQENFIFGGYTEQSWSEKGETKKDDNCFVFSLINKEKHPIKIKCETGAIAICCYKNYGPTFGGGHDICIVGNANENPKSYCNLGCSFKHPKYEYFSDQAQNFFSGSFRFLIKEIEVFAEI